MIVTELNYSTDLNRGVVMQPLKNAFLSGDQEAHRFVVDCYRGNSRESVPLTGAVVNAYFIRADGGTVAINGSVVNGEAVVELPAACYAVVGRFSLVIKASLGDVIHTILWVEGAVSRSHTGTVIDPGEVVPTLDELLAKISTMEQATAAAQNVVSQYDSKVAEQDGKISQLSEEIARLGIQLDGEYKVNPKWENGVFEANGYTNSTNENYCRSAKLPAGEYAIVASDGYYFEIYTYKSDTSGEKLRGMGGGTYTFTANEPFVISSRKNPTAAISAEELLTYNQNVAITLVSGETGLRDDVNGLEKATTLFDSLFFFYHTQRPTIVNNSDRSITVDVPANPRGIYVKNGVIAHITDSVTAGTFDVPPASYFLYDIANKAFVVMTYQEINASDADLIVLFHNSQGYLYGQWERYLLEDQITDAIDTCKTYADNVAGGSGLPSYYDEYMPERLAQIRKRVSNAGNNGVTFAFISDIHYDPEKTNNMRKSPLLMGEISRKTPVKQMICGGDMTTYADSQDAGMELLQETIADFRNKSKMGTFLAIGNHEFNNPGASADFAGQQLTRGQVYPFVTQGNYDCITLSADTGAYIADDPKNKVRYLFAACNYDSTLDTASIAWLIEELPFTPADYDIVLISHLGIYYNPTSGAYTGPVEDFKPIMQALQAYKAHGSYTHNGDTYDFSDKTGTVLGAFLGHYHVDGEGTWYDIPCIMITTDSLNQRAGTLERTAGTVTEQAFDIVTIDRDNKTIYCTRIGAGEDRSIQYN